MAVAAFDRGPEPFRRFGLGFQYFPPDAPVVMTLPLWYCPFCMIQSTTMAPFCSATVHQLSCAQSSTMIA